MTSDPLCFLCLQVQPLRLALSLRLEDTFPGGTEVLHVDPHTTLTERHETSLGTDGLDVGTGKVILLVDELVKINVFVERHLGGVESEDLLLGSFCIMISTCFIRSVE
jgi:hypothetical protein